MAQKDRGQRHRQAQKANTHACKRCTPASATFPTFYERRGRVRSLMAPSVRIGHRRRQWRLSRAFAAAITLSFFVGGDAVAQVLGCPTYEIIEGGPVGNAATGQALSGVVIQAYTMAGSPVGCTTAGAGGMYGLPSGVQIPEAGGGDRNEYIYQARGSCTSSHASVQMYDFDPLYVNGSLYVNSFAGWNGFDYVRGVEMDQAGTVVIDWAGADPEVWAEACANDNFTVHSEISAGTEFGIAPGALFSGRVTDASGQGIPGICIETDDAGGAPVLGAPEGSDHFNTYTKTDEHGYYQLVVNAFNNYHYTIRTDAQCAGLDYIDEYYDGADGIPENEYDDGWGTDGAVRFDPIHNETVTDINFVLGDAQSDPEDADHDGIPDGDDQCLGRDDRIDVDNDEVPDCIDPLVDRDGDEVADDADNCPALANGDQSDSDGDGLGDACDPNPSDPKDRFTTDYLRGKTLYLVDWITEDDNDEPITPQGVVYEVAFGSDGSAEGLVLSSGERFTLAWAVDATGLLYFDGNAEEGYRSACDHGADFIRSHYVDEWGASAELWFFDRDTAVAYAATMPEPALCLGGPGYMEMPTADIAIDGGFTDWNDVAPVATDPAGDQVGSSATDLTALYAAVGDGQLALRLDVDGIISMPHTPGRWSNYDIALRYYSDDACRYEVEGLQVAVNYADAQGHEGHQLDQYGPDGSKVQEAPTAMAYLGRVLEVGFSTDHVPAEAGSVRLRPWVQSWDANGVPTQHDRTFGSCVRLTEGSATPDADGNDTVDALTDGLLIIRHLFGFTGTTLTEGAVGNGCTHCDGAEIAAHIESIRAELDIDGNGITDALTDGLLVIRYLFGFGGTALIEGAVGRGCIRCNAEEIAAYGAALLP